LETVQDPALVVGNGVLSDPVPEKSYKSIIRLNNYVVGGLSGTRTTHWVTSGYKDIQPRPLATCLIPWPCDCNGNNQRHDLFFGKRVEVQTIFTRDDLHLLDWFPTYKRFWVRYPSTGFCLLAWLHREGKAVDVIGFDGMVTGHQDNPRHKHDHRQTKRREWKLINTALIHRNLNIPREFA
jgi:hypothetical protein